MRYLPAGRDCTLKKNFVSTKRVGVLTSTIAWDFVQADNIVPVDTKSMAERLSFTNGAFDGRRNQHRFK